MRRLLARCMNTLDHFKQDGGHRLRHKVYMLFRNNEKEIVLQSVQKDGSPG